MPVRRNIRFAALRRMIVISRCPGHEGKRVQGWMRAMGLDGRAPGPSTSLPQPGRKMHPHPVWSADVAHIGLARGLVYWAGIRDWYSRKVLSRRISNTINAGFGVDCLEEAIRPNGKPEVFNSAQRSRFGSEAFTGGFETGRDQDQHGRKRTGARQYMGGMA